MNEYNLESTCRTIDLKRATDAWFFESLIRCCSVWFCSCFSMVSTHCVFVRLWSCSRTGLIHSCFSRWALGSGLTCWTGLTSLVWLLSFPFSDGWLCRASACVRLCFYSVFHTRHPTERETDHPVSYLYDFRAADEALFCSFVKYCSLKNATSYFPV